MRNTIALHEADQHAPYAHYLLTIPDHEVAVVDPDTRTSTVQRRGCQFVLCYFCGHWNERKVDCRCVASCHAID